MDVDQPDKSPFTTTGGHRANAEAGPSSQPDVPTVFLPPPGPSRRRPLFDGTQDLISRFQLLPSYDKYVRPFVHPVGSGEPHPNAVSSNGCATNSGLPLSVSTSGTLDKGKGREIPVATPITPVGATPGADGGDGDDADEDVGKDGKKAKNTYKHLIKGIPGKHSIKKDDYLHTMMMVPPKQRLQIKKFDESQREAFSVSLEGLKGWNINALIVESAQAREDRKKRKELKKLAKAQAQAVQTGVLLPAPPPTASASAAPTPTTAATPGTRRPQTPLSAGIGTPRPQGPGPGPPAPAARMNANGRPGTPALAQGAAPPRSTTPATHSGSRGKKRELEEDSVGVGGGPKRAPPGSGGVKSGMPRPSKRPRTDAHSMGLPLPQQQPTPQGV
ncbi:hypothetical protein DFH11DRAFT_1511608 [Phellopilus nigrolimitatus]|nr:hypothetical protein DFH11DRAFT_1511608 [Phellopilus nigrolimitatus]